MLPIRREVVRNKDVQLFDRDINSSSDSPLGEFNPPRLSNQWFLDEFGARLVRLDLLFLREGVFFTIQKMNGISIVGHGRVGASLATALARKGIKVSRVIVRNPSSLKTVRDDGIPLVSWDEVSHLDSEIVIVATGDSDICHADRALAAISGVEGCCVLHTSGLLSSEVLRSSGEAGASIGSMHPLASFPDEVTGWSNFQGASFCLEGESDAVQAAEEIVKLLGGNPFTVKTGSKALYHAAAVMACGNMVALLTESMRMLTECGLSEEESLRRLEPLVRGTIDNLFRQGSAGALTGPFSRLDAGAVEKDLEAIESLGQSELTELFSILGRISVRIAVEAGGDAEDAGRVLDKIRVAK